MSITKKSKTKLSIEEDISLVTTLEDTEVLKMFQNFCIPDEMLRCFNEQYPIRTLLSSPLAGKLKLRYHRYTQTWLATVYKYCHENVCEGCGTQEDILSEDRVSPVFALRPKNHTHVSLRA